MKLYGLIGFPLGHSFSAKFFNEKFSREGIDAEYRNFELEEIDELMELLAEYPRACGLNVTIPYKKAVIPYLTDISAEAKAIGAVNTIKIVSDNSGNIKSMCGYNTDAPAFARTLAALLPNDDVSALVLGTGGASQAVVHALTQLGISHISVSRTPAEGRLTYADLTPEIIAAHRIIVNTTPVGMSPHVDACPDIPYEQLTPAHICYDLIYNPAETLFMKKAAERGATVKNGLDMLRLQALIAWRIWNTPTH